MHYLEAPLVVAIITWGIYKLFELFAHRRERLNIVDKISDQITFEEVGKQFGGPSFRNIKLDFSSYGALKIGLLLLGIGLGLMFAFFVTAMFEMNSGLALLSGDYRVREITSIVYTGSVLVFGGAGLVAAFLLELRLRRERKTSDCQEQATDNESKPEE